MSSVSDFSTDKVFNNREELCEWLKKEARSHSQVIIIKRSKTKNGYLAKIIFMCERGGVSRSKSTPEKSKPCKKIGCKFEMVAKFSKTNGVWSITMKNSVHNHERIMYMEGHAYPMRLTDDEFRLVADLSINNVKPSEILATLKERNPENVSSNITVYNAKAKLRTIKQANLTPIQVVMSFLKVKGYEFQYRTNNSTNQLEELFWIHPVSYEILRAFPHILLMDATYNTNIYNLPFFEIVGVTSTSKTFSIAFVLIDKEKTNNFIWVLNCLKSAIGETYEPRVIVTDRDLALMSACETVFPKANKLLCRWHILHNIFKICKKDFDSEKEWNSFLYTWKELVKAPTMTSYTHLYNRLQVKLIHHPDVLTYLHEVWLNKYAHMFVSVATDKSLNFGNSTTNRVESQHAKVKLMLGSSQSRLDTFVPIIDKVVWSQVNIIKESLERSKIFRWPKYDHPSFQLLWGWVSHSAIKKIYAELGRVNDPEFTNENCGCQLRSCFGLPCAHELASYLNAGLFIPLESIDVFWKILHFSSCIPTQDGNYDCDPELEMISQIQEPAVHNNTRGRPSVKVQKQKAKQFHTPPQDPPRRSYSNISSSDGFEKPDLNQEPARHSSYVHRTFFSDPLLDQIPVWFQPYVTNIHNVLADGNCGFSSVASCLGLNEKCWPQIRRELLEEIRMHQATYATMFGEVELLKIYEAIDIPPNTTAIQKYWMILPIMGFLIASRYNVVLLFLSNMGDTTCLPLWSSPPESQQHYICVIARVNGNHFVKVDLQGYYPVPPTHPQWNTYKYDVEWERPYKNQQDLYLHLRRPNYKSSFANVFD